MLLLGPACSCQHTPRTICPALVRDLLDTNASGPRSVMFGLATRGLRRVQARRMCNSTTAQAACTKDQHITWQEGAVRREAKERVLQQRGCVIWFTGLSGSGKSTVACTLEHALFNRGVLTTLLDGDNIRHGLNCNLGFCEDDRAENIRRVGEVTKLFVDTGIIALASFISPYTRDRDRVRARLGPRDFIEVYLKVPLEVCEARDAKGLYKLARAGKIKGFTGIDDPYEAPENPEITLEATDASGRPVCPETMARTILNYLESHGYVRTAMANNAVKGPARAIADWTDRKMPVLDYSI